MELRPFSTRDATVRWQILRSSEQPCLKDYVRLNSLVSFSPLPLLSHVGLHKLWMPRGFVVWFKSKQNANVLCRIPTKLLHHKTCLGAASNDPKLAFSAKSSSDCKRQENFFNLNVNKNKEVLHWKNKLLFALFSILTFLLYWGNHFNIVNFINKTC